MNSEMTHELKILPQYFAAIKAGDKNFELRKDDRNYRVGDTLILSEWTPEDGYTGEVSIHRVTYILRDVPQYGLQEGYCILGMSPY